MGTLRASSEGMIEMTSKTNQVLRYFEAMAFLSSTIRNVDLSMKATKKVRNMSIAKRPLTTLSMIERNPTGSSSKPNSNGETHAV